MVETSKIKIVDDCLENDRFTYINYTGPNPWGVAKYIGSQSRGFFHLGASGWAHSRTNWDVVGENISFYALFKAKKDYTAHTNMIIDFKIIGKKSKATNHGNFMLQMNGRLETNFEGWAHWVKPIYLIYSYLFYYRQRRKMLERCKNGMLAYREEIKKHFNIQTAESITRAVGSHG